MKKVLRSLAVISMFTFWFYIPAFCDEPGPPPPPAEHGSNGDQSPAGAPIDGGLGILLVMGAVYGGRKYLQSKSKTVANN